MFISAFPKECSCLAVFVFEHRACHNLFRAKRYFFLLRSRDDYVLFDYDVSKNIRMTAMMYGIMVYYL